MGVTLHCNVWAFHCNGFSCCEGGALGWRVFNSVSWIVAVPRLESMGSVVVMHKLSCSVACGIFPSQQSNHVACTGRWILYHWATRDACASVLETVLVPAVPVTVSLGSLPPVGPLGPWESSPFPCPCHQWKCRALPLSSAPSAPRPQSLTFCFLGHVSGFSLDHCEASKLYPWSPSLWGWQEGGTPYLTGFHRWGEGEMPQQSTSSLQRNSLLPASSTPSFCRLDMDDSCYWWNGFIISVCSVERV